MSAITLSTLRTYAVARSLAGTDAITTLERALERAAFVQADPIRAPAVAQDLELRHRVKDYRAGDLEARYRELPIEEDYFVNYGFVTPALQASMHPRTPRRTWTKTEQKRAAAVLDYVREKGTVHPREVDAHFAHGTVKNWWGGQSSASTQLLDGMHYRGLLRVAGRKSGIRLYRAREPFTAQTDPRAAHDRLVDAIVARYAPLPEPSLRQLLAHLGLGAPQWRDAKKAAFDRAKSRLACATVEGHRWYWPAGEDPAAFDAPAFRVWWLSPFDPVVWDRRRFELLWGWAYRFEAYTPAKKRVRGYYALPMLVADDVVGWANVSVDDGVMDVELGYAKKRKRDKSLSNAIDEERARMAAFLRAK
ncbi:MAG: YcaQ family DNA glycosylase [Myxococcales bacterium]|nr:YcaQ family DNA glycosylase [Myxococcales bacterium]